MGFGMTARSLEGKMAVTTKMAPVVSCWISMVVCFYSSTELHGMSVPLFIYSTADEHLSSFYVNPYDYCAYEHLCICL